MTADTDLTARARAVLAGHDDDRTELLIDDIGKALGVDMAGAKQDDVERARGIVHAWLDEALPSLTFSAQRALWNLPRYLRDYASSLLSGGSDCYALPRAEARGYAAAGLVEITSRRLSAKILRIRSTDLGRESHRIARLRSEGTVDP